MTLRVLGLGTAAMDIVLKCEDLPREDGFSFVHQENLMPGGSCANVLVTLANMGVGTGLVAQVGDDRYGKIFKEELTASGVNTDWLFSKEKGVSLHTFITVGKNGAKAIFAHLGDSLLSLPEEKVHQGMLQDVKVFYTDMFAAKPALKLARMCKAQGIPVVFNLQCAPSFMKMCQVPPEDLAEILTLADLIFSCREGLAELAQKDTARESGRWIYEKFQPRHGLVFTLGEKGSICFYGTDILEREALPVPAVDTTGAGDAFAGGFIYAYFFLHRRHPEALSFANACAALKCTQWGARFQGKEQDIWDLLGRGKIPV